jgi:cytochrome c oxidase assembly protein subunit 11
MTRDRKAQRRHTAVLALLAAGMFGFAFALVPLYEVFCELTGLNGKTSGRAVVTVPAVPESDRVVTVQFLAQVGKGLPWEFRPTEHELHVRPGEIHTTLYYARNRAGHAATGQAVPSVTPGLAALHLQKIECFCFNQQRLAANEDMEMPVRFFIDADLPPEIRTVSLAYTMYPIPELVAQQ